ncbi:MAG: phage major capsid protein [Planctomycetaceae bacterium]|nr:phage major capsid protein [Planctomycetaceae bacterium]
MIRATSEEIQNQIASLMAEADALNAKANEAPLSAEEQAKLDELVSQIEALQQELAQAQAANRIAAAKARMAAPKTPAPIFHERVHATPKANFGEALGLWLKAGSREADNSPDAHYRAKAAGVELGKASIKVPVNYNKLAFKNRTIVSKGGAGTGAEWVPQSYSDKVSEYLAASSPILGLVASETTSDGNNRTYFRVNDTAMEAAYTSASGGTETVPTIPDTNLVSGNVTIGCFDLTSGYQKITFNELRDSAINLEEKIAKASANSFARKMEREVFTATGNGSTGVQGIDSVCTDLTAVASWTIANVEAMYFALPSQYRQNCIWACNGDTYAALYSAMKSTTDESLFGHLSSDNIEYDVLYGKKIIVSSYIADDRLYFFNPDFYMLRLVEGQIFQRFDEKFFPNVAWAGILSFGGAWVGDPAAALSMQLTS